MKLRLAVSTLAAASVVLTAARCGDADDPYDLTDGEVIADTTPYVGIDYELTSDNYKHWLSANAALDSAGVQPAALLNPRGATDDDIERVVNALTDDERARAAIGSADISVRDYVLTSVALAQTWDAVDRPGSVTGIPAQNVACMRTQPAADADVARRPRARFIRRGGEGRGRDDKGPKREGRGKGRDRDRERGGGGGKGRGGR